MAIIKRAVRPPEPKGPTQEEKQEAELARLKAKNPKPLDEKFWYSSKGELRSVFPCVKTAVYQQVMKSYNGVTAVVVARNLETTLDVVLPHLRFLCGKKHIFIKRGRGAIVRVEGYTQTFAKYVLYNPQDIQGA